MARILLAFRVFFAVLFSGEVALRIRQVLTAEEPVISETSTAAEAPKPIEVVKPPEPKPKQSEAITLLSTLQREARLVDFLKEDLSAYADEQVGAAVREIQRESGAVLDRLFGIRAILADEEGSSIEVPTGFDAARFRLTGKLAGAAPFHGTLRHHGWEATKCELPEFTGSESAGKTITPAEVEVQ